MDKTPIGLKPGVEALTAGQGIDPVALRERVVQLLLREENNLMQINDNNEVYVDLQLPAGIAPTDDFPVGVTTGRILQADGRPQSGTILNWKTTSGDYIRFIYANDGNLYIDKGQGVWNIFGEDISTYKVFYMINPVVYPARAIERAQEIFDYLNQTGPKRPVSVRYSGSYLTTLTDITNSILYIGGWDGTYHSLLPYPQEKYILFTCPFDSNGNITSVTLTDTGTGPVAIPYQSTEPSDHITGMLWYDTTNSVLKIYDGNNRQTI